MEIDKNSIELLAPAGDLEKLKFAVEYGANAVYMGGKSYGLRAKAKNFGDDELSEGIAYAHARGVKVYVTVNIFAHNYDFDGLSEYLTILSRYGADAIIVSDPGIFSVARKAVPNMDIHISTQANTTNFQSVAFWQSLGAKRVVLARELSIDEISQIHQHIYNINPNFELECFVHGAMCISYSGRCLLSNYMTGRDSNRGECTHPCRWKYNLVEEQRPGEYMPVFEDERGTYIFNSKDLCMINNLEDLINAGVQSFKIEGRMKSPYYVAATVKAYREAIDDYFTDPHLYREKLPQYLCDLKKVSHRDFTTGFYHGKPAQSEQVYTDSSYIRNYDFVGVVTEYDKDTKTAVIEQRNKFSVGEEIEFFKAKGQGFHQTVDKMFSKSMEEITDASHPKQIVRLKTEYPVEPFDILRKPMSAQKENKLPEAN